MSNGGPPNKWSWFKIDGMTGDEIGQKLNDLGSHGFTSDPVVVKAKDGTYLYIGGYAS